MPLKVLVQDKSLSLEAISSGTDILQSRLEEAGYSVNVEPSNSLTNKDFNIYGVIFSHPPVTEDRGDSVKWLIEARKNGSAVYITLRSCAFSEERLAPLKSEGFEVISGMCVDNLDKMVEKVISYINAHQPIAL